MLQVLKCQSVVNDKMIYDISYDKLVIGVGAISNTFGVPGVEEHAFFLKVWKVKNYTVLQYSLELMVELDQMVY